MFLKTLQKEKIVFINLRKSIDIYEKDGKIFCLYESKSDFIVAEVVNETGRNIDDVIGIINIVLF